MATKQKSKGGRPTKYEESLCEVAIKYLARGKSVTQLSAHIDVAKSTIYKWAEEHTAFSDALTRGQELSQAYWEGELCEMMYSKDVNAPLVKLYFANRFKWVDKTENKNDNNHSGAITNVNYDVKSDDPKEAAGEYLEMIKNG
jgi:transposase-like protein